MKVRIINLTVLLISLAVAVGCIYAFCAQYTEQSFWFDIIFALAIIVCYPLAELLHETGHILFAAAVKIKAVPAFNFFSPSCCTLIPKTDKKLRGKVIFSAFGGLFVNLVCIVLGLTALFVSALPVWLSAVLPASFFLFAFNALPLLTDDGKTDGLVISELIKNEDNAKVAVAVMTVQAQILKGKPYEEVDEKLLFDLPVIREDDPAFISLTQLRAEYFKARGDEVKAEQFKNRYDELKNTYL